ncbi:MAG: hypothetical protein ACLP8A_07000 [Methylovirgula sp.]
MIWGALSWSYSSIINSYEGRIKLKDDQISEYKDKLNGATPAEAKARLDALESQLKALSPRRLSSEQRNLIARAISGTKATINIVHDGASPDANQFAGDFLWAFQAGGWTVVPSMGIGIGNPAPTGLALRVVDPSALSAADKVIQNALEAAHVSYDLQGGFRSPPIQPTYDLQLVITAKLN